MTRVRWTRPALNHLREIADYVARDNPEAARRVVNFIRERANALAQFPNMGRSGRLEDTREIVVARFPYIVVYRLTGEFADILAVVHTSRRWPAS